MSEWLGQVMLRTSATAVYADHGVVYVYTGSIVVVLPVSLIGSMIGFILCKSLYASTV